MKTNLDWRSRAAAQRTSSPSPARSGGTPKFGKTAVTGKTKPDGDNGVNLASYKHRRVGHKSK